MSSAAAPDPSELVEADILKEVPKGHDAYLAKNIVHGFPDGEDDDGAARVAGGHGRRLAPGAVIEVVVPEDSGPYMRFLDLQMLVGSGGPLRLGSWSV
jgi:hypothetical protein